MPVSYKRVTYIVCDSQGRFVGTTGTKSFWEALSDSQINDPLFRISLGKMPYKIVRLISGEDANWYQVGRVQAGNPILPVLILEIDASGKYR